MRTTLLRMIAAKFGFGVFRLRGRYFEDGLYTLHSHPFSGYERFRAAYARGVQASGGYDPHYEWRVHIALWAAHLALRAAGDFVECGVNAGFISSAIMQDLNWDTLGRRYLLFDTFQGPVWEQYSEAEIQAGRVAAGKSALEAGQYVTDVERVRANFSSWRNAAVIQGEAPEILYRTPFGAVAFLHLDMNCALPEVRAFEFLWDRLSDGGVVLLDDFAYYGHGEQMLAMSAAVAEKGARPLTLPTGQGLVVKGV